jgi:hypothetical protein
MTVEAATYTASLNSALPTGADAKAEGDDHIRLIKSTLLTTFPGMTGAMTATHTQLNKLVSTFSIASAPSNAVNVDSSGNVGIGAAASAVARLTVDAAADANAFARITISSVAVGSIGSAVPLVFGGTAGSMAVRGDTDLWFSVNAGAFAARFDSSGNQLIATTDPWSSHAARQVIDFPGSTTAYGTVYRTGASGTSTALEFLNGGSANGAGAPATVGSITTTTTGTSFNTTSDARLKTALSEPIESRIPAVKVRDFTWRDDGAAGRGVFAQELAAVIPEAVHVGGEELDDTGRPLRPWAVDYSKLVPDLIIEVQALRGEIDALKATRA